MKFIIQKIYSYIQINKKSNFFFLLIFTFLFLIKTQNPYKIFFLEKFYTFIVVYEDKIVCFFQGSEITGQNVFYGLEQSHQRINSLEEADMISLGYIYNENSKGIYVVIKNYIYYGIQGSITMILVNCYIEENKPSIIIPYKCIIEGEQNNNYCYFFVILINSEKKLKIYEYIHLYNSPECNNINEKIFELMDSLGKASLSKSDIISCQIMKYNSNKVLICFYENEKSEIGSITFNPESLELDKLKPSKFKKNTGALNIKSVLFSNDDKAFICYINDYNNIACIIFDLNRNEFDKEYKYIEKMTQSKRFFSIDYFYSSKQYILSCYSSSNELEYAILYDQMNIVDIAFNGQYCLTNMTINSYNENNLSAYTMYIYEGKYKMFQIYGSDNYNFLEILNKCNKIYDKVELQPSTDFIEVSNFYSSENINFINFMKSNKTLKFVTENLNKIIEEINEGEVYEIKGDNYIIKISPINFYDFKETSSFINFLECESALRKKNGLSIQDILTVIMIEIEKNEINALTNQIEYAIFYNKKRLDLSICNSMKIQINYHISNDSSLNFEMVSKFSELGIDILNSKDNFFNDICFAYSENNSDIILRDRILNIYQNYSKCDENCEYEKIDLDSKIITCKCTIKNEVSHELKSPSLDKILLDIIIDSSFGVVKCYKLVFNFSNKYRNIGFIIFTILIIIHIPLIIYYFKYKTNPINEYILIEMKKNNYITVLNNPYKKPKCKISSENYNIKQDKKDNQKGKSSITISRIIESIYTHKNKLKNNYQYSINSQNNKKEQSIKSQDNFLNIKKWEDKKSRRMFKQSKKKNKIKEIIKEKTIVRNDCEYHLIQINANNSKNNDPPESTFILDNYDFEEAIKFDKRKFCKIYYICLIAKENILNICLLNSPLELKSLRFCMFIFVYSCDFALNTLFYFNDNISDKYYYKGNQLFLFTLVNNISISIISLFLSYSLETILQFFTNSKESTEELFREEEKKMRKDSKYKVSEKRKKEILINIKKIIKNLKIKILIFIVTELLIMLFFYYFVTSFCEVYKETQISWITDSFVSFLLSFPLEFANALLITILYKLAINKKIRLLYIIVIFFYNLG